jgi:HAD superfamily hydrolase (TIGR01509 family)
MTIFPNPIEAVIFDMDGLLFDTERLIMAGIMAAGRDVGVEFPEAFCHSMIGIPGRECDIMIQDHFGPAFPMPEYLSRCAARIASLTEAGVPLKTGVVELIDDLAQRNIPLAIATSSSSRTAHHHLQKSGLLEKFRFVVTRDDVQNGKPKPDLFTKAAMSLGVSASRCLALEDSPNGIRSAHAAGTMPVMVPDILQPSDEIRAMCIVVADSLHDVRRILR